MSSTPHLSGVLSAAEIEASAQSIADLQLPTGMIPWFVDGHCDPWNHVETAMALDIAGMHDHAERAYEWLVDMQRPDGSWWNYYLPDGSVEEAKLDSNVCAYVATGVWHHWLCTWDRAFVDHLWPTVERAVDWVLGLRRADGTILWAINEHDRPWDYALLTGSASIAHALHCAAKLAALVNEPRPDWAAVADRLAHVVATEPDAFEPKTRWAMDWYYPVLTGALTGEAAKARLADRWDEFCMEGKGIRCVSDEPCHRERDGRERHRACRDRRSEHRRRSARVDPLAPPRRWCVLDRHRLPEPRTVPLRRDVRVHGSGDHPRRGRDHRRLTREQRVRRPPSRLTGAPPSPAPHPPANFVAAMSPRDISATMVG